jgi:DNA invertase Pin-like site-specific DNA recombinase
MPLMTVPTTGSGVPLCAQSTPPTCPQGPCAGVPAHATIGAMAKLWGYVRVSTEEQSSALQVDALVRAGVALADIIADDGVSGSKPARDRPGFARLLAAMAPGDELACYALSRVGRSTLDVLGLLRDLDARGITFRSVTEPIETRTHVGKLVTSILAAVAEMERNVLIERTRDGVAAAKARGAKLGRPRKLGPDAVAALRALVAGGASVRVAAATLGVSKSAAYAALAP